MPVPKHVQKIAKTFRKDSFEDLREYKKRVKGIDPDINRKKSMDYDIIKRLKFIRDIHRTMIGIETKKKQ